MQYRVRITRDTSETGWIEVDAPDEETAEREAMEKFNDMTTEEYADFFEADDSAGEPYVSDIEVDE